MNIWLRGFLFNAFVISVGYSIGAALICGLIAPALAWLFTQHWSWMPFNKWLNFVLLGIPIGIFASGILTIVTWTERTDAPLVKKILASASIGSALFGVAWLMAQGIRMLTHP